MDFSYDANSYRDRLRKLRTHLANASPSDRVAGALVLAGALLALTCLLTDTARSAGL